MKNRLVILTALVFVLIAAACSPAGSPDEASSAAVPPTAESTEPVMPAEPEAEVVVEPTQSEAMVEDAPTDVPTDEPVLVRVATVLEAGWPPMAGAVMLLVNCVIMASSGTMSGVT